jgi:TPR repeat protein
MNISGVINLLQKTIELGNSDTLNKLADCYEIGMSIAKDFTNAIQMYYDFIVVFNVIFCSLL